MQERRLGSKSSDNLVKIYVNEYDDFIFLDKSDTTFTRKFAELVEWMEKKQEELEKKGKALDKKYAGKPIISQGEDENVEVDTEQLLLLTGMRVDLFKECVERIDGIFGEGTIRKYFRMSYEHIPDYTPDDAAISDFLEEITPVLEEIYKEKMKRMDSKYNRNRKGKHSKSKEELLAEAKALEKAKKQKEADSHE